VQLLTLQLSTPPAGQVIFNSGSTLSTTHAVHFATLATDDTGGLKLLTPLEHQTAGMWASTFQIASRSDACLSRLLAATRWVRLQGLTNCYRELYAMVSVRRMLPAGAALKRQFFSASLWLRLSLSW